MKLAGQELDGRAVRLDLSATRSRGGGGGRGGGDRGGRGGRGGSFPPKPRMAFGQGNATML